MPTVEEAYMKTASNSILVVFMALSFLSCASSISTKYREQISPAFIVKPGEPIAIMPFETESALSNLGGQVSDEVIVNLLEYKSDLKIIPATVVRNYLLSTNLGTNGIPDMHTIHNLQQGLKCRYLLTGNLYTSIGEVRYTATYTNRIASGSVTVRLVDCDSSNVVWAKHVQSTYTVGTYYSGGTQQQTTFLTDGQLLQGLIKNLGYDVARNFYEH
jgi:TolB-like protein